VLIVDREDIQGILLHGYRSLPFARYHLLSFAAGEARRVLSRLVVDISSAAEPRAVARHNLALTASGLRALGLGDPELTQFSREFRQGMAHPERAAALGDVRSESPEHWHFGGPNSAPIDALYMTFAASRAKLEELCLERERLFERFGATFRAQDARLRDTPRVASERPARRAKQVPLGEFVLGQRDVLGERHPGPFVPVKYGFRPMPEWSRAKRAFDFGQNGSYLALRQLERNGSGDPHGDAELVLQHARRALGPEQSLSHRLLRRSRNYDGGLWFIALNADLRRQFEFVQQSYLNAPAMPGPASDVDPLVGRAPEPRSDGTRQAQPRFLVRGGAYFFLPGIRALNYLAEEAGR